MERRNYNNKTIIKLINAEGEKISKNDDILEEIRKFYNNLYTADSSIGSNESFQVFTESRSNNLPKLSKNKKIELEGKLALKMPKSFNVSRSEMENRLHGESGFAVGFYKHFFDLFGQEFLDSVNAAYDDNELTISQRRGVITLIPKEDANLKDLSNGDPLRSSMSIIKSP